MHSPDADMEHQGKFDTEILVHGEAQTVPLHLSDRMQMVKLSFSFLLFPGGDCFLGKAFTRVHVICIN